MSISRRALARSLVAGALGTTVLAGCRIGPLGRDDPTTPAAGELSETMPDEPLRIGAILTTAGPVGQAHPQVIAAINQAMREINYDGGVFGREVELLEPRIVESADDDLGAIAEELAADRASALVLSVDDAQLVTHLQAIADTGMALVSPTSTSTRVRSGAAGSGLLTRLAPTQEAIARHLVEESVGLHPQKGGAPGTIAFLGTDDEASENLRDQLTTQGRPHGAKLVLEETYPFGKLGDAKARAKRIAKAKPAMLVLTGGEETGTLLGALHHELADDDGRPRFDIAVRLPGLGARDHAGEHLPKETLKGAQAIQAGGAVSETFRLMMLNADSDLVELGPPAMGAATQAYDAVALLCLAAQQALSLEGTTIAGAIPDLLDGETECADVGECVDQLRSSLQYDETASIAYALATGDLALGKEGDPVSGALRTFTFAEDGAISAPTPATFDLSG
ncbi:ABC transporter substrate-binding protein [Brachybacterium kimchii]|uniref:ABC transporter substrate-binding protein n=1 Tax=Brachybacterium kimchii TaxID=2942909 RepID=A0ABY4N8H3_9MICO|nr:ABC transporter substrate-binding protein [Brachybacterium kimchii]UQN30858.1 ABC transporter substrate-binding protein [Brachybacterium kimchii]